MALFNKFFQSSKRKNNLQGESTKRQQLPSNQTSNESCIFPFSSEQVRVVLFRECDWTGRRLLFDSSAVQKVCLATNNQAAAATSPPSSSSLTSSTSSSSASSNNRNEKTSTTTTESNGSQSTRSYIDICNGYGYIYDQSSCDTSNNIGEMVFGSVAMSFKGTSLKVHWLREPTRILCSQVFLSPTFPNTKAICGSSNSNSSSNASSVTDLKANESGNVPTKSSSNSTSSSFSLSLSLCMTKKLDTSNELPHQQQQHQQPMAITTIPLDVPAAAAATSSSSSSSFDHHSSNYTFSGCDSGFSGTDMWTTMSSSSIYGYRSDHGSIVSTFSTDPSISSSRKLSVDSAILVDAAMHGRSSDGCLQRRIQRNMSTSFENSLSGSDFIGYFDECKINHRSTVSIPGSTVRRHSVHCNESRSNPEMQRRRKNSGKESLKPPSIHFSSYTPRTKTAAQRRSKIGLAVCIRFSESAEEEMQLFCSEHIALLESMLCRLRAAAETAFLNQKRFHQLMLHAWIATTSWITDLFTAPRIKEPVWFSLSNSHCDRPHNLAKHFMSELCSLLNSADTKDTNFFVSTLLTAILTNHLGWVATVAPIINSSACNDQMVTINQNQAKMSEISKFHPYNVLWAQLGDLYGSIGSPTRLAKTVVCGAHTVTINKVLSILTYFVRCGEIQRVNSTKTLNTIEIEELMSNKTNRRREVFTSNENKSSVMTSLPHEQVHEYKPTNAVKGLSRSKTCLKEITTTVCQDIQPQIRNNSSSSGSSSGTFTLEIDAKMHGFSFQRPQIEFNTIENELSNTIIKSSSTNQQFPSTNSTIKLMVTSPNNDRFEYETASEALDFILKKIESPPVNVIETIVNPIKSNSTTSSESISRRSLWRIDPVKDGISIDKWKSITNTDEIDNVQIKNIDLKRSHSLKTKVSPLSGLRRSKTFREFGSSSSPRVEPTTANYPNILAKTSIDNIRMGSLVAQVQKLSLKNDTKCVIPVNEQQQQQTLKPAESVVFVLGDNEVLSGLKTPPPSPNLISNEKGEPTENTTNSKDEPQCESKKHLKPCNSQANGESNNSNDAPTLAPSPSSSSSSSSAVAEASAAATTTSTIETKPAELTASASSSNSNNVTSEKKKKKHCTHKKHSGVKFNFEQYPQIVTNYMKNKNLDITSYDFLEKGLKLEQENAFNYGASSTTSFLPMFAPEDVHHELDEEEEQCECCANTFRVLQTPSNATELEFSNDDDAIYPVPAIAQTTPTTTPPKQLSTVNENDSMSTLAKCDSNGNENGNCSKAEVSKIEQNDARFDDYNEKKQLCNIENSKGDTNGSGESLTTANSSSTIGISTPSKDFLELITLPIPKTEIIDDTNAKKRERIRPGYVPSLFVGITDHFIPDMVLQGITAPVHTWEPILKQNLTLASHCATFEQTPTENIAIIANIDKWDVKLVSSQAYALSSNSLNGPIGMSQLVSTMLETVHAMWMAGTSAPQCMSFLESKLKEIYLQSETLAAFLLATEFCSLNTVTTALNLSANDVPLLLSVASIHSPQVTKKYGISFR